MIEVYVGFGVLILGAIFGIISYFIKRMVENFDRKLDMIDGKIEFLVVKSTTADTEIIQIKKEVESINENIDNLEDRVNDLHSKIVVIQTQHNTNHPLSRLAIGE